MPPIAAPTCNIRSSWLARDDGALSVLAMMVVVGMLLVAGLAVDMMRTEHERVRMQGAADRAVVAATLMRSPNGGDPAVILEDFMRAEGLEGHVTDQIVIDEMGERREVGATPVVRITSMMAGLLGMPDMTVSTPARASEVVARIDYEVVMVLDVSGSMADDGRMQEMRAAAHEFARTLFRGTVPGQVAISLVPYSTEVRLPSAILDAVPGLQPAVNPMSWDIDAAGEPILVNGAPAYHDDPACIDLADWSDVRNLMVAPAVQPWVRRNCVGWSSTHHQTPEAQILLTDPDQIAEALTDWGPVWGTHIDIGVLAGALLFDPGMRPAFASYVPESMLQTPLAGRPFSPDRPNTVRALVMMTDGANCCYHVGDPSTRWETPEAHDAATVDLCRSLRDVGVTIYGVAFQASERGLALMQGCASSPSHVYTSGASGLTDTFRAIGRHIQVQLPRLIR